MVERRQPSVALGWSAERRPLILEDPMQSGLHRSLFCAMGVASLALASWEGRAWAAESLAQLSRTHGYVYVIIPSRGDIRDPLPIALQAAVGR